MLRRYHAHRCKLLRGEDTVVVGVELIEHVVRQMRLRIGYWRSIGYWRGDVMNRRWCCVGYWRGDVMNRRCIMNG